MFFIKDITSVTGQKSRLFFLKVIMDLKSNCPLRILIADRLDLLSLTKSGVFQFEEFLIAFIKKIVKVFS